MPTWVFVRHGQSVANARRVLSGWDDVALTALGRSQARRVGRLLAERFPRIGQVVSSDLRRARETAALAMATYGKLTPRLQIDARLRERNLGDFQGQSIEKLRADGRMRLALGWNSHPPGGESLDDLARRCLAAIIEREIGGVSAVFAHGGVVRVLVGMAKGLRTEQIGGRKIENGKPIVCEVSEGAWEKIRRQYCYD